MNSILTLFRVPFSNHPVLATAVLAACLVLGVAVGYRMLGPALFG